MDSAPEGPRPPRSTVLTDFVAAREAAAAREAVVSERPAQDRATPPQAGVSRGVLSIALIVGLPIFVVGVATSSILGAIGAMVGLAVTVCALVMLVRRAETMGRLGLGVAAGFLALVVGLMLGIQSYDEKYFGDREHRDFWDAVSLVGYLLIVGGLLFAVVSLLGVLGAGVARLVRRG